MNRNRLIVGALVLIALVALIMAGNFAQYEGDMSGDGPLPVGEEVRPPPGCVELRKKGGAC